MEAFLTGVLYVLGGGCGLAVLGVLLNSAVGGISGFRNRKKEPESVRNKHKRILSETRKRADNLLTSNEQVKRVVDELGTAAGKRERAKLQKQLRGLVGDEAIRREFYIRTR
jgi:hypothetical protein